MNRFSHHFPYITIAGAFALVLVAAAMLCAFVLARMTVAHQDVERLRVERMQADILLTKIVGETSNVRLRQNMTLIAMTDPAREKERAYVHESIGGVAALISSYERFVDPSRRNAFEKWRDAWNDYVSMNDTLNDKELNESRAIAIEYYLYPMQDAFRQNFMAAVDNALDADARQLQAQSAAETAVYEDTRARTAAAMVGLALLCLLLTLVIARMFSAQIHHPKHIKEMSQKLDETMHRIGEIAARIETAASGGASPVATVSHDLTEQTGELKQAVATLLTEVKED
jgi:hypothetical protein